MCNTIHCIKRTPLTLLVTPLLLFAQQIQSLTPMNVTANTSEEKKVSPVILNIIHEMRSKGYNKKNAPSLNYLSLRNSKMIQLDRMARIQITVTDNLSTDAAENLIIALEGKIVTRNDRWHKVVAWIPYQNIIKLAASENIRNIKETEQGYRRTGSVTSEGDTLHNTLLVRQFIGADGSGKTVGVISDGCDNIASAQATGDLPGTINVINNSFGGDEGTAMLEIIHDLAPGAGLAFSEGVQNYLEFINSISDLVSTGCDVIVDDIGYFGEPWFEEGPIATAAREAIENDGIIYASSAGNSQDEHYEGDFNSLGSRLGLNDVHDFGGGDWSQSITIGGFTTIYIYMQWNDPFGSSGNNYVIHLADADTTSLLGISSSQLDPNDPYAYLGAYNNSPFSASVSIVIERLAGSANRRIELEYNTTGSISINEYNTFPGSINGQPAVSEVITTGAVRYNTPDLIEYFSSIGPSRIYSYPSYDYEDRLKPDLVAVDGNQITGAGGFGQEWPSGSGDIRFFGTSASAPHAAAGAAVVWSAYPTLTNTEVKERLLNSAVDLGISGFDFTYGYGRMDVQQACDSPLFTVSGINSGSDALISSSISPGDALAELTGYVLTADQAPYQAYLDKIQFTLSGSAQAEDFNDLSLYIDQNTDRHISPSTDLLLATEEYSNPLIFENIGYLFDNTDHQLILTADVSNLANPDHLLIVQLDDNSDVVAYFNVSAFSTNFPFVPADISLPVQFQSFNYETENNKVRLFWDTASELNTLYYEIERQIMDKRTIIARIEAVGNTSAYQQYSFIDTVTIFGEKIVYSLFLTEKNGSRYQLAETKAIIESPLEVTLLPNYPNPFNPVTVIPFTLPFSAHVFIDLYNSAGQQIKTLANDDKSAGFYEILFDGTSLPSGIYYARLHVHPAGGHLLTRVRRIVLIK